MFGAHLIEQTCINSRRRNDIRQDAASGKLLAKGFRKSDHACL